MSDDFFDLEKVRQRWTLVDTATTRTEHPRLTDVAPEVDPIVAIRANLTELHRMVMERFWPHRAALNPFLDDAATFVSALEADPKNSASLASLAEVLDQLEELTEAYTSLRI